ncbi:flavin-binding monooxygenase-like domain-containing protein [Hirsutella rhossiliensis]|uniref:Flavin-binding monooxygenase-like domain-containing protein n=1 Tax=Hirsutella rhossiliensis TaxID=111463 RepID=A0A9P8MZ21_9HYPO|nr:flavin-binding monooxygenase-like domain-containing protein [Hirsutella rhossiliensis]KAH0965048.1 flavin-binding monooxygenase-like domain-containing protein [Hirsutella rhossiliensis]
MGSIHPPGFQVKAIAIVGAGPSGLAAAHYLKAQAAFDRIAVFEQQHQVGGVWNYTPVPPGPVPVPQTSPFFPPDAPVHSPAPEAPPVFPSPMYEELHANIPKTMMSFWGQPFPAESCIFPSRDDIQGYLLRYAQDSDLGRDRWRLLARSTVDDRVIDDVFDAVVVANGHYSVPFVPHIQNIASFHEAYPAIITHAKQYRTADAFRNKKVIIVGNGPSGTDIALQINKVSKGKTLLSIRSPTPPERLAHTACAETPEIDAFLVDRRGVRFKDGRVETDVDAIVFCTGYLYSFPFLPDLRPSLITNGQGVHGLYKHLFYIRHPTLAFASLPTKSVPWHLAEAQAAALAAVWSNGLELPLPKEMQRWSSDLHEKMGQRLQLLRPGGDYHYINELHDWVVKAKHLGKEPPRWSDEDFWQRSMMLEGKRLFEVQGCKATTLDELGLRYDPNPEKRG